MNLQRCYSRNNKCSTRIILHGTYKAHLVTLPLDANHKQTAVNNYQANRSKGRDTQCGKSLRHVTMTGCCNKSPHVTCEIIVAATEFCRCDLSHEFKLVWIRATYCSDKISASSLVAPCVRICDKWLQQNLNQPMRKHQLVSRHVKFVLVEVSSLQKLITCTEQVSYRSDLSQYQFRWEDLAPRCVSAICRIVCLGLK